MRAGRTRGERLAAATASLTFVAASFALAARNLPEAAAAEPYTLDMSTSPNRSSPAVVAGQNVSGSVYLFTLPEAGVKRVLFYLDDPARARPPRLIEKVAPYDFAGTAADGTAKPFDTTSVPDGVHTITAAVERTDGLTDVLNGDVVVANSQPALTFSPNGLSFTVQQGKRATKTSQLSTNDSSARAVAVSDDAAWMTAAPSTGTTPLAVAVDIDAGSLAPGTYNGTVTARSSGLADGTLAVTLRVSSYTLKLSSSPDRVQPAALDGATASGDAYAFVDPAAGVKRVRFWLDDVGMAGSPRQTENSAPWDFVGGNSDGTARPFDTTTVADGAHTITAAVELSVGSVDVLHSTFTVANGPVAAGPPDQVHLAWVGDPATTLTAVWRTLDATAPSTAEYRRAGQSAWQQVTGARRPSGTAGVLHEATLTGLESGAAYEYRVTGNAGVWSSVFTARTAPAPGPADFDAVYVADTGLIGRADGLATGTEQVRDEVAAIDPTVVLGGGDFAYFDTDKRFGTLEKTIDEWFRQMEPVASTSPLMPTYGNHEIFLEEGFDPWAARFPTPAGWNGRRAYSFDVGDVHFTSIFAPYNSGGLPSDQLTWIDADLAAAKAAGKRWLVPFFHVAPFSDGSNHPSNTTIRSQLGPIFETHGVKVVLTSHDQSYERTYPLQGVGTTNTPTSTAPDCYTMSDGVTYVKVSPGGKLSNISGGFSQWQTEPPPPWTAVRDNTRHHFARVVVSAGGELRVDVHGVEGDGSPPTVVDSFRYTTGSCAPGELSFTPGSLSFAMDAGQSATKHTTLNTSSMSPASFEVSDDAPWLTVNPATGTTPGDLAVRADSTGLSGGTHTATVTATAPGQSVATLEVTLTVGTSPCGPFPCSEALVELPYELDFSSDHGGVADADGAGTGFTYVDPPSKGAGYVPSNLHAEHGAGHLRVTTTKGIAFRTANSQDNALGVGVDPRDQITIVRATLHQPPAGSGAFEQAGVWFGNDEDNYAKVVLLSTPEGTLVESHMEVAGVDGAKKRGPAFAASQTSIELTLRANPADRTIRASYAIAGGDPVDVGTYTAPPEFFSFDGARIDPAIGTDTFMGIMTTHRNAASPVTYAFDAFSVTGEEIPPESRATEFPFLRSSFPVPAPTSMAWGPDGRLYVTEMMGVIHRITFDADMKVVSDQPIQTLTSLGPRLTLGVAVDPDSTPDNVILWVSHSHPQVFNAPPNTSMVTKLSGSNFATRQDVITGLPRSKANHAVNSIHFGPDGKLYLASGGNTGAGAPNDAESEFGDFEEQPLSAALLVADVKAAGFDGTCDNSPNLFAPNPCDVQTWATGLRNIYDFTWHSNGNLYGPDNGLGVTGTYPPSPTPPCTGMADPRPWTEGGDNPGSQPDPLHLLQQGKYYGHPNPHRDECVFMDGSFQDVPPPVNFAPGIHNLGNNRSANGTIEYASGAFQGGLRGALLIANYSVGDDITMVKLGPDGRTVLESAQLAAGFSDPLPVAQAPNGSVFVGEFGGNKVSVLVPDDDVGSWTTKAPMPQAILDAGGTALGGKLYSVGGKTSAGPVSSVRVYDPGGNVWTSAAPLPGPAVENPAVVGHLGKLYAFGGATEPFEGAVTGAHGYDPASDSWTALAPMPTARSGAAAQVIGTKIYVAGGMDATGASVDTVESYDPATNSWSATASMSTRRDNPGSAVLGGKLYVFGGRTRNADGTGTERLSTVESYDPATNTWTARAAMPTARRTMVTGTLNGRAQAMGGEKAPDGNAFAANEEYNPLTDTWRILSPLPTPRHGAAAGTIGTSVYVAGGGPVGGSSFTAVTEAFSF